MAETPSHLPEEAAQKAIAHLLQKRGTTKESLARLDSHSAVKQASEQLAVALAKRYPGEMEEEGWADLIYYLLRKNLQSILHPKEERAKQGRVISQFLQSDIQLALDEAIDKGAALLRRGSSSMTRLIETTAIEVQQILLRAKRELQEELSPGKQSSAALREVARLEEQYALPSIEAWLRRQLCLIHVRRLEQELERLTRTTLTRFEAEGRTSAASQRLQEELTQKISEAVNKALERSKKENPDSRVLQALTHLFKRWEQEQTEAEALSSLLQPD